MRLPGLAIARLKPDRPAGCSADRDRHAHRLRPRGKVNLVAALAAIGEPESTAILQHFAVYDKNAPKSATACEDAARPPGQPAGDRKSQPAQQAIARSTRKAHQLGQAE
jgi:hypothetical protein